MNDPIRKQGCITNKTQQIRRGGAIFKDEKKVHAVWENPAWTKRACLLWRTARFRGALSDIPEKNGYGCGGAAAVTI
jgi:hypothetical protein